MKDVFDQPGPQRLVAGGIWFLILMVICGVFWWLWSVVVSRFYGPVGYGIFNTAQSLFNFAWAFIFGGLFGGLIKHGSEHVARSGWKIASYFSMALKYLTLMGVIVFLILSIIAFHIDDTIFGIMIISIALSFLFSGTKDALASIIGSFQKNNYLSVIDSSKSVIVLLGGLLFIALGLPSYMLPVLLVSGTIWQLGLAAYFLKFKLRSILPFSIDEFFRSTKIKMFSDFKDFSRLFVFGIFVSIGMISFNVMKSLDIVVMNMFFSYGRVGVYSVSDMTSSILFYMTSFSLPIIPAIAEAYVKRDKGLLKKYVKISLKYPLLIGIPLTLIIFTMAEPLVIGMYGTAFTEAIIPLQVLIIGTFMLMFGYNLSSILIGIGKPKLSGLLMALAATQYIISLFILIPLLGFMGAALSLTLTGFTSMLLVPYFLKKELKLSVYRGLPKVLLASLIMFLILSIVPKSDIFFITIGIITSVAIFILSLRAMNYITGEDSDMVKAAWRSLKIFKKVI